jgi:DNA-binding transcriptional MerR regulator
VDLYTEYVGQDGHPLLTAAELAGIFGVQPKTIHAWEYRGHLQPVGLGDSGEKLYDALEAALAEKKLRSRGRRGVRDEKFPNDSIRPAS